MTRRQGTAPQTKPVESSRRGSKRGAEGMGHIDLNIRIKDDGGPLYNALAGIKNSHARGERVRQLMYVGVLIEGGAFRGMQVGAATMAPIPPTVPLPASPAAVSQIEAPATPALYDADDLVAVFGSQMGG